MLIIRGLGEHGQLGIPNASTNQLVPVLVSPLAVNRAVEIVSGWWHSMAITRAKSDEEEKKDDADGKDKEKDEEKGRFLLAKSTTGMVADKEFDRVWFNRSFL